MTTQSWAAALRWRGRLWTTMGDCICWSSVHDPTDTPDDWNFVRIAYFPPPRLTCLRACDDVLQIDTLDSTVWQLTCFDCDDDSVDATCISIQLLSTSN